MPTRITRRADEPTSGHSIPLRVVRVLFGLLPIVALLRQLAIHVTLGFDWVNFFSYYTTLSNLFAGCVLFLSGALRIQNRRFDILRAVSVINMSLVGIVFSTLLKDADVGSLLPWVNIVHHYLMPCVIFFDWMLVPPRTSLGWRELAIALAFPLVYVAYSLLRGARAGWYPYPFLNPQIAGGAAVVGLYIGGIAIAFIVVGWALLFLGRWRRSTAGHLPH